MNLLLFVIWAGSRGCVLSEAAAAAAIERVRRWHDDVVRPLRALRRRLKGDAHGMAPVHVAAVRTRIATVELDVEHVEQLALGDLLAELGEPAGADAVETNLAALGRAAGLTLGDDDRRDLATIVAAAS